MNKAREWVETGKMYESLIDNGYAVDILMDGVILITAGLDEMSYEGDSIYETLKVAYFTHILDIPEDKTDVISFDLPADLYDKLYDLADQQGIIVDELVIDILSSYIDFNSQKAEGEPKLTERELVLKEISDLEKVYTDAMPVEVLQSYLKTLKSVLGK